MSAGNAISVGGGGGSQIVDATIIDNSANAVSGNAVFDALAGLTPLTLTAVQALTPRSVVIASGSAGCDYANNTVVSHIGRVVGFIDGAAAAGVAVQVLRTGPLDNPGWTWTPNLPVFVTTAGQVSQTEPAGAFVQIVGFALTATRLWVSLSQPIRI